MPSYPNPKSDPSHEELYDLDPDQILAIVLLVSLIVLGVLGIFSCVMLYKCMKKRSMCRQIKEEMRMKRHQFAAQMGMSLFKIDDRLGARTFHL